jgi:hypothetical protein
MLVSPSLRYKRVAADVMGARAASQRANFPIPAQGPPQNGYLGGHPTPAAGDGL